MFQNIRDFDSQVHEDCSQYLGNRSVGLGQDSEGVQKVANGTGVVILEPAEVILVLFIGQQKYRLSTRC